MEAIYLIYPCECLDLIFYCVLIMLCNIMHIFFNSVHWSFSFYVCTLQDFLKITWISSSRILTWKQYVTIIPFFKSVIKFLILDFAGTGLARIQRHFTETRQCQPGLFCCCVPPLPVCGISLPVCCPL